jgi:serine/threonine-protein phosphatase 5
MTSDESEAITLKNLGNKAFAAHDWLKAIDFYTQAITADPTQPSFYTNRAQVRANSFPSSDRWR